MARSAGPRALAALLAAALLLAGCSVELDGAPCRDAGATADCPEGQACGNDLRCSTRALGCAGSRCTPGVGGACLDPEGPGSGVARARRCTDADPVCGAWVVEPCAASGFACGLRSGGARCECPASGSRELTVSPDGSPAGALPYPTGAPSPAVCSYLRLSDALSAAALLVAEPTAIATVTAVGAASGGTRTFSAAASGETFPLVVPERVALTTDCASRDGSYEIVFDAAGAASAAVELHSGAALSGFTVRNGSGDATADAVALRCSGRTAPARLEEVVLDGRTASGARLGHGFVVDGTCGVVGDDVHVRDMSLAAVAIDAASSAVQVALTGGSLTASGDGVLLKKGRLFLDEVRVAGNAGMGVRADDFGGIPRVEIRRSKVVGNGDTGLALVSAPEVRVTDTTVFANGAVTSWGSSGLPSKVFRRAGGVVLWGTPPVAGSLEFGRNRIYANSGDQVLVLGAASTWNLNGTDCGSDASGPLFNSIGCYDPTPAGTLESYRGLVAIDASVSANKTSWSSATPSQNDDLFQYGAGTLTFGGFCPLDPTLACSTESPSD